MKKAFSLPGAVAAFFALTVFFPAGPAWAEEVRVKEMVITATRTEHDKQDVPASVDVLSKDKLREMPHVDIADALKDIPGVEVFDQSVPGAKRVQIRGESGARVMILIDGQKISEQKSMDGAALLIDPSRIERLEVIKGPASILYGSEAIGGVVNIITKKGGPKPVSVEGSLTFDSSTDGFTEYLSVFGGVGGFSYRASGSYNDQGDRRVPGGTLSDTSYMSRDTSAFLGYDLDKASFGLSYDEYWSNVNSRTPEGTVGGSLSKFDLDLPVWERKKLNGFAELRDMTSFLPRVRLDAFHQDVTKKLINIIGVRPNPMISMEQTQWTKNDQESWGATLQTDILPHTDHYLILGYDLNVDQLDSTTDIESVTTRRIPRRPPATTTKVSNFEYEAESVSHALYLQDEWTLPADFALTLGARQTWTRTELGDTNNPTLETKSHTDSHPVFSAGVTWSGLEYTTLRALFSQGYRFPNLQQLYIGTVHGGVQPTYPNPDLKPETSNNYELGARFDNGNLNLDMAVFLSNAKDYITIRAITGGNQFANINKADTHGAEASISYTFEDAGLTPYASATWLRRHFKAGDFSTWKSGHPEFSGRAGLRYDRDFEARGISAFADLYVRAASDAHLKARDGSTDTSKSWQTLNLALGTTFGAERQHFISLNLLNILDKEYTTAANSIEDAGAHAVIKAGFTF